MVRRIVKERLKEHGGVKNPKKRPNHDSESDDDSDEESAHMMSRMTLHNSSDDE